MGFRNLNITGMELEDSEDNEELLEIPVSPADFEDEEDMNGESSEAASLGQGDVPRSFSAVYQNLDHFLKPPTTSRKRKKELDYSPEFQPGLQVDDDYHFLISFLPSLKQMNYQTKMWFRLKMQELLYTCALNAVSPSAPPPTTQSLFAPLNKGTNTSRECRARENGD